MASSTYVGSRMKYVSEVVDPLVADLVHDILLDMPPSPVDFTIGWLRNRAGSNAPNQRLSLGAENKELRSSLTNMTSLVKEMGVIINDDEAKDRDSSDEDDDDDDVVDDIPIVAPKTRQRQSVSAEAYGDWNKLQEVLLPKYEKTMEQKNRLQKVLSLSFLFSSLEDKEQEVILDALEEKVFSDERIIQEGNDGDCLYVVESGNINCKKIIDGQEKEVKVCQQGDVFGELALLYNCPRAASVDAAGRSVCWRLDRQTFNQVVKQSHIKRAEKYDAFVQSISVFATLEQAERSRIIECFKIQKCTQNESVVKQGDDGDRFYIVEEGALVARKAKPDEEEQVVKEYGPGDYFGELALLKDQPRQATVVVTSPRAKLIWMDRKTFTKMLGPLQGILEKRAASYT